jgi:hypothetical protein
MELQVKISPAFYARLFRKAFLNLDLRFVLFWRKNIGAKAARNILVKLATGDYQIKISLEAIYSFERLGQQVK